MGNLQRLLSGSRVGFDKLSEQERLAREADISTDSAADSETDSATESGDSMRQPPPMKSKRKADGDLSSENAKTAKRYSPVRTSANIQMKYPNGAIRMTRTQGRDDTKNCINLEDIIDKKNLVSACIYSYFMSDNELFHHLPFSKTSNDVPIYIGRDASPNNEPEMDRACKRAGLRVKGKVTKMQLATVQSDVYRVYQARYGKNFHAFNAWAAGSAHTKMLALVYPTFLRLVITSCNMMDIDTVHGDNHWYIHDLPKLSGKSRKRPMTEFEDGLMSHLRLLRVPEDFVESIEGLYDYSSIKVHLITSVPGTFSGSKAERHGLLRLRNVVKTLNLGLPAKKSRGNVHVEVCTASIGNLNTKWLNGFHDCVLGKKDIAVASANSRAPEIKIVFPTSKNVESASAVARHGASNIGCHTRPWPSAPNDLKALFHHYKSKDPGCLFHQKLIAVYDQTDKAKPPHYIYIGSANLSQSAWGALEVDKRGNAATGGTKLVKMTNYECGVLIPGHLIHDLLEPGTSSWIDGVIPYRQDTRRYDLQRDWPWNDPRWRGEYDDIPPFF